jgi:alpha-galactosidase
MLVETEFCQTLTTALGWNSWNTFKYNIDEKLIESTAKRLVNSGLAGLGYKYVNMDDGWQTYHRDNNGRQQANATKFPNGIRAVADYVHGLGLKLGIYRYTSLLFPASSLSISSFSVSCLVFSSLR